MKKTVRILIISPLEDELLKKIKLASGRVHVDYVPQLVTAEYKGQPGAKEELDPFLREAEVIYGQLFRFPNNTLARSPKLKWIQGTSAGVDMLPREVLQSPVKLTTVRGIQATAIAEFVLLLMLGCAKRALLFLELKQQKKWKRFPPGLLQGKTVGIIGLGKIGREIARLSRSLGMRVLATRRTARVGERARYVDRIFPPGEIGELLPGSDFVVLALPLTAQTNQMFGEKELRAMKAGAYLINIARGPVLDEKALIRALEEKWIAGAALDVFAAEPLPPENRLWDLPNVIVSPHIAGFTEDYELRAAELFCRNLERYLGGKRLLNLVDKKKGY